MTIEEEPKGNKEGIRTTAVFIFNRSRQLIALLFFSILPSQQAERFLDRKVDRAESRIKKSGKKWYSTFIGNEKGACLNDFHLFLGAFVAGVAFGVGSS